MAAPSDGGGGREGSAKSAVADQISQSVQSTSNMLHLMLQSSPAHVSLSLSLSLCAIFGYTIPTYEASEESSSQDLYDKKYRTGFPLDHGYMQVLEQMPLVISSLDEHVERGLQSVPHLNTVVQLLSNMQSSQLKSLSTSQLTQQEPELLEQHSRRTNGP
ncbi:hypothetical protein DH2020_001195 [Rehmannia glutinosa]|uniref:Tobamovirus multiplication protein 2B n=1 Tax=Rehmannia glutinosa TaxID=99300 RepID=A0ABR0XYN7_REHGL